MRAFRTAPVLALSGAAVAVAVACTPFASGSGGTADAGPDAAGGSSGQTEAGSSDAGSSACPSGHFCDPFDRDTPTDSDWQESTPGTRVTLSIDKSVGAASLGAFRVDVKDGGAVDTTVLKHPVGSPKIVHVGFSLRRTAISGELQFLQLIGGTSDLVYVALVGDTLGIVEYPSGAGPGPNLAAGTIGAWARYQLDVDYAQKTVKLTSSDRTMTNHALIEPHPGPYTLWIGATALPSSADATVWLDDLDVWTE